MKRRLLRASLLATALPLATLFAVKTFASQPPTPEPPPVHSIKPFVPQLKHLDEAGRYHDLYALSRHILTIVEAEGADSGEVASAYSWLAEALVHLGKADDAKAALSKALDINTKLYGEDMPTAMSMVNLASFLDHQGKCCEGAALRRSASAIYEKKLGHNNLNTSLLLRLVAYDYQYHGQYAEAAKEFELAKTGFDATFGENSAETIEINNDLAYVYELEKKFDSAEIIYRHVLTGIESRKKRDPASHVVEMSRLANVLAEQEKYAEAEPLQRRLVSQLTDLNRAESITNGPAALAVAYNGLASTLQSEKQFAEAESLYRRNLHAYKSMMIHPTLVGSTNINLASTLESENKPEEAEPYFREGLALYTKYGGPVADANFFLAVNLTHQSKYSEAIPYFRLACKARAADAGGTSEIRELSQANMRALNACATRFDLALWATASRQSGISAGDSSAATLAEAFYWAQRANPLAADDDTARAAALAAAKAAGLGAEAVRYESLLVQREALDQGLIRAASEPGEAGVQIRQTLFQPRAELDADIASLEARLKAKVPGYWDLRLPEPITIADLQSRTGPQAGLLRAYEALILFMFPGGQEKGLVFAVGKDKAGWARVGITTDDLNSRLSAIRARTEAASLGPAMDAQTWSQVYQALLGDPAIKEVMNDEPDLVFVLSGPLATLPSNLMVTWPPPNTLARRTLSVAQLPSISGLRMPRPVDPDAASSRLGRAEALTLRSRISPPPSSPPGSAATHR